MFAAILVLAANWDKMTVPERVIGSIGAAAIAVGALVIALAPLGFFTGVGIALMLAGIATVAGTMIAMNSRVKSELSGSKSFSDMGNAIAANAAGTFGLMPQSGMMDAQAGAIYGRFNTINPGSYQIPMLATGAVIPPNRQFLAVLGDQKHGTNIEAPLSTIEADVRNVVDGNELAALLQAILDALSIKQDVVLDTGALVGHITREQRANDRRFGR